jgi:aspartyl-tRNA(Asn)/glutamyl-tRNA(Gln) amidotransferase subunit A
MSFSLLSAHALTQLFRSGELSAEEIVEGALRRIKHFDPELGAFLTVFDERAREKARRLDQKRREKGPLGRLAAVPIALKDNIHLEGELTTCASKFLQNYRAPFDATVTRLLE